MSMNSVCLQGNVTRDPISTTLNTGTKKVSFTIAVNEKPYVNKAGEEIRPVNYFDVEAFASGAEVILEKVKKGTCVSVQGMLKQDRWEKDGKKMSKVYVRCMEFTIVQKGSRNQEQSTPQDDVVNAAVGDNVPF